MKDHTKEKALFESAPILQAILTLAIPTVIGQIILVVYNIGDTFFIGMTGNDAMLTAVTICMPAFMFLSAISNLFGVGGSSVISRALGAGNAKRAGDTAAFAFCGCLITVFIYALSAWLFMDRFINLLGGSDIAVHAQARKYLLITVVLGGTFATMGTFFAHLVRSEGRSLHASIGIALGGILNLILDPIFMFVLLPKGEEVMGAALATGLSNLISMCYFTAILRHNRSRSVLRLRFSREMFADGIPSSVFTCGLPACLMTLFENISYAMLDNLIAVGGVAMQAGIGVAKKVNMLAHCMVRGMAQGVLPLISYNFAANNHQRMRRAVLISTGISIGLASICMVVSLAFNRQLVGLFIQNGSDSLYYSAHFLRILCIGGPFSACAYAIISFFQAVGSGFKSFVIAILRKGVLDIPMMFLLNRIYPIYGIVWATPIADILCCAAAICLFCAFLHKRIGYRVQLNPALN